MFVRELNECAEIIAGDNTTLRELYNSLKDDIKLNHSLAHAVVKPGQITYKHKLASTEIYYILEGEGEMFINEESRTVTSGCAVYIPPDSIQYIKNTGETDLKFLCIVEPAWRAEDEQILE